MTEIEPRFKVPRTRSVGYLAFLGVGQICAVPGCHATNCQVHHLTCGPEPKARGLKSSDLWCLPICFSHHDPNSRDSIHAVGDERSWWRDRGIADPVTELCLRYLAAFGAQELGAAPVVVEQIARGLIAARERA